MKKGISLLLAVVLAFCFAAAGQAREFEQPQLTLPCRAAVLIHQDTGTVLYQMNADTPMPIASITNLSSLRPTRRWSTSAGCWRATVCGRQSAA